MEHRQWNPARQLPSPNVPLLMRLSDGDIKEGIRPSYIANYASEDLGYRDEEGERVDPVEWSIR